MRDCVLSLVLCGVSAAVLANPSSAAAEKELSPMAQTIVKLVGEHNIAAAVDYLNSLDTPQALSAANEAVTAIYWDKKDLPAARAVAEAAIAKGQKAIDDAKPGDAVTPKIVRGAIYPVAYNLASFTWPGWGEPGITVSKDDATAGLEAAKLALKIAEEVKASDLTRSRVQWALGAQQLAQGEDSAADKAFSEAAGLSAKAGKRDEELLAKGYLQVSMLLRNPSDGLPKAALERTKATLTAMKDGKEFAEQLDKALQALTAWRAKKP